MISCFFIEFTGYKSIIFQYTIKISRYKQSTIFNRLMSLLQIYMKRNAVPKETKMA